MRGAFINLCHNIRIRQIVMVFAFNMHTWETEVRQGDYEFKVSQSSLVRPCLKQKITRGTQKN